MYSFVFATKAINLNNCRTINARGKRVIVTKSKNYLELEAFINLDCSLRYKTLIERFNQVFCKDAHYLNVNWRFYTPDLFLKAKNKNGINQRSGDLSNLIKPIEDCLFNQFTSADDSHVVNMNVTKIYSEAFRIECDIEIKDLNSIL